eukprot:TRINITY_DN26450_c0_g1_i1.p1 TRINITY_DN26450_c0_g1~~TRINITY_DN26450_c0_g1_i1.p1  ORF type:complete len:313 (+),score=61.22 TRINITY_DN26450_c0_g1_i1:71-1009(+)
MHSGGVAQLRPSLRGCAGRVAGKSRGRQVCGVQRRAAGCENYVHGHARAVVAHHARRTAEQFAKHTIPHLRPGARVLDVGCGPGSITRGFAKHLANSGSITAVDVVPEVLEQARAALAGGDAAELKGIDISVLHASAYALPFADGSFDVVHAHQLLQHLQRPAAALREMRRVTAPGGVVTVREVDYESWLWYPAEPRMSHWKEVILAVGERNGNHFDAGRRVRTWLLEAGFPSSGLTVGGDVVMYADVEACAQLAETWAQRVSGTKLAEQAVAFGLASEPEVREMAQGWREWGAHKDAMLFYVDVTGVARKE